MENPLRPGKPDGGGPARRAPLVTIQANTVRKEREPVPTFSAPALEDFAAAVFRALDVPEANARRVACSLVDANLCGHDSHGLIRVVQYADALRDGRLKPRA